MIRDMPDDGHAGSAAASAERPLLDVLPSLRAQVRFCDLGVFPTPVQPLAQLEPAARLPHSAAERIWIKRDDISSPIYGGNKVRTLEVLFGEALRSQCSTIVATGAYGSNHAVATVLHAPRVGLEARTVLFPQPYSETARDNLRVAAAYAAGATWLPHWAWLPWGMRRERLRAIDRGQRASIMPPGGAMPLGALGYVSAAMELALQVQAHAMPAPRAVVLAVGSTCTSAGLLLGLRLAERFALVMSGAGRFAPRVVSVRVTPWPVTSRFRIVGLARRTAKLLYHRTGDERCNVSRAELSAGLSIEGEYLGKGYGQPTQAGLDAIDALGDWGRRALDTTYAAKSAAALLQHARLQEAGGEAEQGPLLYWATKSSVPLPVVADPPELPERAASFLRGFRAPGHASERV